MYTRCPNCNHSQQVSRKQLKKKQGQLSCTKCKQAFNGYLSLSKKPLQVLEIESLIPGSHIAGARVPVAQIPNIPALKQAHNQAIEATETEQETQTEEYAWQKEKTAYRPSLWLLGIFLGLIIFASQIYYFKGYSFSQNSQIRPWLNALSSLSNSRLPDYRKPLEYTTVGSSLEPSDKGHYRLQVSLINHADFRQPPPYLQLTLKNFYGGIIAQRIFTPTEFLGKSKSIIPIQSDASLDIDFLFSLPEQEIGGYSIALK